MGKRRTKEEMAVIRENQAKIEAILKGPRAELAAFRAVIAIWKKQTDAEQRTKCTTEHNGVGFNHYDAKRATWVAEWMMGVGWNAETTLKGAQKDGVYRRRAPRKKVQMCKDLAWKYRKQLRIIAYGA